MAMLNNQMVYFHDIPFFYGSSMDIPKKMPSPHILGYIV